MHTAEDLITRYKLQAHSEGGYYHQTYKSTEIIPATGLPNRFHTERHFSTAIYFLLAQKQFSAFHRIKSDELWHFYSGVSLHIYVLHHDGRGEVLLLGSDITNGYSFQQCVPAGCWFASMPVTENDFSFVGCTVAPGFDFVDFEIAEKKILLEQYPQHSEWINKLCKS